MHLGFGCVGLGSIAGGRTWRADRSLVLAALDRGVTLFDTADAYASGSSERILGRAVAGRRDEVVLATKGGYVVRDQTPAERWARRVAKPVIERLAREGHGAAAPVGSPSGAYQQQDFSPTHLQAAVEASLRRLRTDHIDVYQLHGPPDVMPDVVGQLQELVTVGKVRRLGIGAESVESAASWAAVDGIAVVQLPFGILDPEARDLVLPLASERSVELWARGIFGGGTLAALDRDPVAFAGHPKARIVQDLRTLAAESGLDIYGLAAGFVRSFPEIAAAVIGTSSADHLERNVALLDAPPLPADVLTEVSAVQDRWRASD